MGRRRIMMGALASTLLLGAISASGVSAGSTASATNATNVLGPVDRAKGEPVTIGVMSDGSNATTDNQVEIDAVEAAAKYLNEHKGGLGGRPIKVVSCVSALDPAKTTDCANEMVQDNVAAVVIGALGSQDTAWKVLHDAHIPMLWSASNNSVITSDAESSFVFINARPALIDLPLSVAKQHKAKKVTVVIVDVPAAKDTYETIAPPIFKKAKVELEAVPIPLGTADMTPTLQQLAGANGEVHVVGNDAFCIAAFNAMRTLGFKGSVSGISQCITDATRKAVPGSFLKGIAITSPAPVGIDDSTTALYRAVAKKYGHGIDTGRVGGASMFMTTAGLQAALAGITGDITPATVIQKLKAMKWMELPGSGGMHFRCNGKATPNTPAICVRGTLQSTLNNKGQPASYKPIGDTPIED